VRTTRGDASTSQMGKLWVRMADHELQNGDALALFQQIIDSFLEKPRFLLKMDMGQQ
jgi:hypothetical protein